MYCVGVEGGAGYRMSGYKVVVGEWMGVCCSLCSVAVHSGTLWQLCGGLYRGSEGGLEAWGRGVELAGGVGCGRGQVGSPAAGGSVVEGDVGVEKAGVEGLGSGRR